METSAIMENRTWRLPQGLRRTPVWWRSSPMRFFGWVRIMTVAVALWALMFADAGWAWWALALFGCFLYGCVGLSVGFQRYSAHRSFEAPHWAVVMCRLPGVMTSIGAGAGRSVTHRHHHMHADGAGDPHPAKALCGRVLPVGSYEGGQDGAAVRRELRRDRFGAWLYRHYLPWRSAGPCCCSPSTDGWRYSSGRSLSR